MPPRRRLSLPFDGVKARTMRELQGLTLKDLASRTETVAGDRIDASAIWRYENGHITPTAPRLRTLATALDCAVDDLLTPASEYERECA